MKMVSFSSSQTNPKVYHSLQEIDGLSCARCGRKTITHKKIQEERHKIELDAEQAIDKLSQKENTDSVAFHLLKKLSEDSPQKTVREIVAQENAQAALSQLCEEDKKEFRHLVKNATKMALPAHLALKKIEEYKTLINPNKQIVFEELEVLAQKNKDKTLSEILKMPEVQEKYKAKAKHCITTNNLNPRCRRNNPFRFFAQNKNEDDKTIVEKLISGLENTFEHVKRNSNNGQRVQSNGITLCFDCNNYIRERKYPDVIDEFPQMRENTQKQIDEVIEYINDGELINHENYPEEIKQRLYDESEHIINIDISKMKK